VHHARALWAVCWIAASLSAQDGVEAAIAELRKKADDADLALVQRVASARTRAAAEGLVAAFDAMSSILMQREIAYALAEFAGAADAEVPALEKLAAIASGVEAAEVRQAALRGLAKGGQLGKHLLRRIVDSEAPDLVREPALREHVALATAEDVAWYKQLWNPRQERRKYADGTVQPPELPAIRELAFEGVADHLGEDELVEALRVETHPKIRRAALRKMFQRKMPKTAEMAKWLMERVDFPGVDRAEGARILVDCVGAKAVGPFLDLAKKRDVTPEDLRREMARLIGEVADEATDKRLVKLIGKGKAHERAFVLYATQHVDDPKAVAAMRKELQAPDPEVRRAAAAVLGKRKDAESVPILRTMLQKAKDPADRRLAVEALGAIEGRSPTWVAELVTLAAHPESQVRNAAIEQLAATHDSKHLPVLFTALEHEDWSTRFTAVQALESMRSAAAVGKLIERLEHEKGRLRSRIAEALWRLTGKPFEDSTTSWKQWWQAEGSKFRVVSPEEFAKAEQEREKRRLAARTQGGAKFFGIRIESHRVLFILDTSGSMLESLYGRSFGKGGASRIEVAKQELSQAIRNLDEGALFNVMVFSTGVDRWLRSGIAASSEATREEALTWVERLGAAGATNLFDALKLAFSDPDVDTILLLSDGEPTSGEITDPFRIREEVAFWNKHRRVRIDTIAIGGTLEILEWLAADSGGTHVRLR